MGRHTRKDPKTYLWHNGAKARKGGRLVALPYARTKDGSKEAKQAPSSQPNRKPALEAAINTATWRDRERKVEFAVRAMRRSEAAKRKANGALPPFDVDAAASGATVKPDDKAA